jgi:hypothetical protein
MKNQPAVVSNFEQLHQIVNDFEYKHTIFRGVKDQKHELIPKIGRKEYKFRYNKGTPLRTIEDDLLRIFRERALPFLDRVPSNGWDWMAIAQHHGLPTRLLDWTRNPLVAAYFAVEKEFKGNSAIYAVEFPEYIDTKREEYDDPFKINFVGKFIPPHTTKRIVVQSGLFTIHPDPKKPLKEDDLTRGIKIKKIIIENKNDFRRQLKRTLYRYGIHQASLFPNLDSLSNHIIWMKTDRY